MEFLVVMYPFLEALFDCANSLSTVLQLFAELLYFIIIFLRFFSEVIILILKVKYFFFVFFAILFKQFNSFFEIFIFTLQEANELARFIDCLLHNLTLSLLFLHRYYNTIIYVF